MEDRFECPICKKDFTDPVPYEPFEGVAERYLRTLEHLKRILTEDINEDLLLTFIELPDSNKEPNLRITYFDYLSHKYSHYEYYRFTCEECFNKHREAVKNIELISNYHKSLKEVYPNLECSCYSCFEERRKRRKIETKNNITLETTNNYTLNHSQIVQNLKSLPYKEYLQTEHWKIISQKTKERDNNKCRLCDSEYRLNVHHKCYDHRGEEQYYLEDLVTLCNNCHDKFHKE